MYTNKVISNLGNRNLGMEEVKKSTQKKPFDKKKWREEKYSNKLKVQRWQEKRKSILQKKLHKQLSEEGAARNIGTSTVGKVKPISRLQQAKLQYERKQEEERQRAEEVRIAKQEKLKKIKEYRAKKAERSRKLNQKTRKGQPLMRARLEMLQEKIQKMVSENRL